MAIRQQMSPNERKNGSLNVDRGIVTGRVTQFAEALDVSTHHVLELIEAAGVELMVDTGHSKGHTKVDYERPSDPNLRCLAMTREDFARVLAEVHGHNDAPPPSRHTDHS